MRQACDAFILQLFENEIGSQPAHPRSSKISPFWIRESKGPKLYSEHTSCRPVKSYSYRHLPTNSIDSRLETASGTSLHGRQEVEQTVARLWAAVPRARPSCINIAVLHAVPGLLAKG